MNKQQIKINPNFNSITFKQEQKNANETTPVKTINAQIEDSFKVETKIKPPHISNVDLFFCLLTDEQIAQINLTKMLPPNARFEKTYTNGSRRNGVLTEPMYEIKLFIPHIPAMEKQTRILPKGYIVVKNAPNGKTGAVKIEKK